MRNSYQYILIILLCAAAACKKDNYSPPSSQLKGRLVYKGDSIGLERNQVPFQLYQRDFGTGGAINGNFTQEGTYSVLLFSGDYRLIIPNGQGPFVWKKTSAGDPDSLTVTMKGSQTLDLEVTPYYMIRNANFTGSGGVVTATFSVEKVITDPAQARDIDRVSLYINKTAFVSGSDNVGGTDLAGAAIADPAHISLSVSAPDTYPTQNYFYARIGLKVAGVEDLIFSPVQKIQF